MASSTRNTLVRSLGTARQAQRAFHIARPLLAEKPTKESSDPAVDPKTGGEGFLGVRIYSLSSPVPDLSCHYLQSNPLSHHPPPYCPKQEERLISRPYSTDLKQPKQKVSSPEQKVNTPNSSEEGNTSTKRSPTASSLPREKNTSKRRKSTIKRFRRGVDKEN